MKLSMLEAARLRHPRIADSRLVADIASRLVYETGLEPPIDPRVLAAWQGVDRVEEASIGWSGSLVQTQSAFVITVNRRDHPRRQRFTICHEVSHTFMPGFWLEPQFRCTPAARPAPSDKELEGMCDIGASELLLPRAHVTADLHGRDFGFDAVDVISGRYDASVLASAIRVVDLHHRPAILVKLSLKNKPKDLPGAAPMLRIDWVHSQGRWPFVPRHKSVGNGNPLNDVVAGANLDGHYDLHDLLGHHDPVFISARPYLHTSTAGVQPMCVLALIQPSKCMTS